MTAHSDERLGLLERDRELAALRGAVDRACGGQGGVIVVEGAAGIGKTSLLHETRRYAAGAGMRVVAARGAELERPFPYGVVRQFFESFLFTVAADQRERWLRSTAKMGETMFGHPERPSQGPSEEFALLHSLYWMCVNIADERPLAMVLDDAQWSDVPSLNYVEFTCRRLEQLPFLFIVGTRMVDETSPAPLVAVLGDPAAQVVRPPALSPLAVDQLVRERVHADADPAFARACHEVTQGNPFLVKELVHEVLAERLPATADAAERVRAIGPRGIARVVLLRLGRLPDSARRLAAALSVAAEHLTLRDLAEVAGLDEATAAAAAAGLDAAEIIDLRGGIHFTHPVLRAAIYEDLSRLDRSEMHARAARVQERLGRAPTEIATHLLHVDPGADAWVARTLRDAGHQAQLVGDFADAERFLQRALLERSDELSRAELLAALGSAEAHTGNPNGALHLARAAREIEDAERSAAVSVELSNVLKFSGRAEQAADVLIEAIERLDPQLAPVRRRLQAELLGTRFIGPEVHERVRAQLDSVAWPVSEPQDLLDSFLLAAAAFDAVAELRPAAEAVQLGRRALLAPRVSHDPARGGQVLVVAGVALIWAEDLEYVHQRLTRALADAQAASSALAVGNMSAMRAMCAYRAGRLLDAESDAAVVIDLATQVQGLQTLLSPAVAYAVVAGIDRGTRLDALASLAGDPELDRSSQLFPFTQLSWARGELALCRGEWREALTHFMDCDRADPSFGGRNPAMVPWREGAALAYAHLGDGARARELAGDAVERADTVASPRARGLALRARALISEGPRRIEGLQEAVNVLGGSASRLELARSMCDLGASLRAAGRRTDAQAVLEPAHQLAASLGAQRIAERSAAELEAAGVRPRREPASGLAALTPSERRVAELAALGKTNREIAQSLFVTEKTVETHLGHVYDKLGVRSRRRLPDALGLQAAA